MRVGGVLWMMIAFVGCGDNRNDLYLEGLQIEGAAERGPCQLVTSSASQPAILSSLRVGECLEQTERALTLYDQAAALGLDDVDFQRVHGRARDRKTKLEGMLKAIRQMEVDRQPPSGMVPPPLPAP